MVGPGCGLVMGPGMGGSQVVSGSPSCERVDQL